MYRYDSAFPDGEKVDRAAVDRMVLLRREFYDRMCHECLKEIDEMTDQVSYAQTLSLLICVFSYPGAILVQEGIVS